MTNHGLTGRSTAARRLLAERARLLDDGPTEVVPLPAIEGRSLAEPVVANVDVPAHDVATMDGFAFAADGPFPLRVRDTAVAPEDDPPSLSPGEAVPIATGAPLPSEATAVLKREDADREEDILSGPSLDAGTNVYRRGTTVAAGERLVEPSETLTPKDAALLRDVGRSEVLVAERFSVAVLATGTEIHEGVQPDRDSEMLAGLVDAWGHAPTLAGSVPDKPDRIRDRIDGLADDHDIVVTTGGTSVGRGDHVVAALDNLGEILFRGVSLRPGRPVTAARLDDETVALALPGKPVAAFLAATLVCRPLFDGPIVSEAPPTLTASLRRDLDVPDDDLEYAVPVTLTDVGAMPLGHVDSALPIFERRFRPGRLAASTRATRADAVWLTEQGGEEDEPIAVIPMENLQ
ncbi:molybdopterin molybdotransferase MoeA [Halorubrum amylolyticum]|uniref:molybdopterin molybdotransferase MoeA n=1 Tax=Halorubrum amylolyticum TaxID=2508724 RepID=UPI001008946A|nr:molybdopterin molybdotransferase MoeA [Halorubrum amylolyticum]